MMVDLKMEVYSQNLELIGFLEIQRSVIWEEKAFSAGSFSIESLITADSLRLLHPENIIWIEGEIAGIIECVQEQSGKNGPYITVKGRTLTGILDRRILWGRYDMSGTPPDIMHRLVDDCCINPTRGDVEARKIPGLVLDEPLPPASRLPDGYTELEYIQSSGTQYIKTGYKPNNNTRVKMDVDILSSNPETVGIFGGRDGGLVNTFSLWKISNSGFRMDYGATAYSIDSYPFGRHIIDQNKNTTSIDDFSFQENSISFQAETDLTILAISSSGSPDERMLRCNLYSCKIYDNGTPVRDYIPCVNPSGTVGLYDTVSAAFYGNAGSGVFLAGPSASQTARATSDGGYKIRFQKTGGSLLEVLEQLGETYGVAFGVRFNPAVPQMEFWTRCGQNLTVHQSDNPQVFYSTELDDVLTSEYSYNSQNYRNVSLVAGEGEGDNRVYVTVENEVQETPDTPVNPPEPPGPVKYTVSLLVDPAGGGTASGGKTVAAGVSITVTATPSSGFEFVGWKDGDTVVSTGTAYTFTVTGDRTLTAVFVAAIPTYTITATIDPAGSGTVTGAGQYQEGETCTLVATVADGYRFTGWQENGITVSENAEYTFTATADRAFVAACEEVVSRLPDGYTEVEYIYWTGERNRFEPIGTISANTDRVLIRFHPESYGTTSIAKNLVYYSSLVLGNKYNFLQLNLTGSGSLQYQINDNSPTRTANQPSGFGDIWEFDIDFLNNQYTVSGTSLVGVKSDFLLGSASRAIGTYTSANALTPKGKLYQFTHYRNGEVIHDYVPCINPSGTVGLYDINSGTFIQNTQTNKTAVTAGPAV